MSIENRSLKLPHSSGVLCGQKRSIFGEGIGGVHLNVKAKRLLTKSGSTSKYLIR